MQLDFAKQTVVEPERLHDLAWVSQSVRLHKNILKSGLARLEIVLQKRIKRLNHVVLRRATNTAIRHLIEVLNILPI